MKKLKLFIVLIIVCSLFTLVGCSRNEQNHNHKFTIISTSFPGYDFLRAITKNVEDVEVKMLLKPGIEVHDFEPTPQDIKNIKNSDLFLYVGGDSDEWVKNILKDIDIDKTKIIQLIDLVDVLEEEVVDGMEEEKKKEEVGYDEHVWTSPIKTISIINQLKGEVIAIDPSHQEWFERNTEDYIQELTAIDLEIREVVERGKRREIIFGDRFPIRYFTEEYDLSYYAAFPGCSEQTEASAKTISFLIQKVNEDEIPVVFHTELSSGKIAQTIAEETHAKVLEFHTAHNISQEDFDAGRTYVDIMRSNLIALEEALNL